jgi:hypothetical protein
MANLPMPLDPPREPALTVGAGVGSLAGAVAIVQYLFPDLLTEKQLGLVFIVSALVLPMLQAWITRSKVWSPASVKDLIDQGVKDAVRELDKTKQKPVLEFDKPKVRDPDSSEFFKNTGP